MNKLVSIIMPAYNASEYIRQAIESAQAQTYTNWELLIVDDGSTDSTAGIVKEFALHDPRIIHLSQDRGRQGKARNLAIKHSKGNYIAFLDADDLWTHNKLQVQVDTLESRPDIGLLFTQGYILDKEGISVDLDVKIKEWNWVDDKDILIDGNQIPILSVLVTKEAVISAGLFSEDDLIQNVEDYHLWVRIFHKQYKFLSIKDRLFYYRVHESQSTYKNIGITRVLANCYFDLVKTGIIDNNSLALRNRLKLMINEDLNFTEVYESLKQVFPEKKSTLMIIKFLNKLYPDHILKKIIFRFL